MAAQGKRGPGSSLRRISSEASSLAGISAVSSTVAAVIGFANSRRIKEVHAATNGMKDQLVAATRSDAMQQGHTAGAADEKARNE